jgi:hypothetical protein
MESALPGAVIMVKTLKRHNLYKAANPRILERYKPKVHRLMDAAHYRMKNKRRTGTGGWGEDDS